MCRVELSLLFFFHLSYVCLLFLFACVVVLPYYMANKDEYITGLGHFGDKNTGQEVDQNRTITE